MRTVTLVSAIAPPTIPVLGWAMLKLGFPFLPNEFGDGAYVVGGALLCLFTLPSFLLLSRWKNAPALTYPIIGALAPIPATLFLVMLFGALATEEELETRMQALWFIPLLGMIAGTFVAIAAWHDRKVFNLPLGPVAERSDVP
jgi:heme/copper-type cytochrome/quinol oxidase subunit 4